MKVRFVFAHFRIEVSVCFYYVCVFMYNCLSGEDCCSVSDTGGSYKNSSTPRIGVEPITFWLLVRCSATERQETGES